MSSPTRTPGSRNVFPAALVAICTLFVSGGMLFACAGSEVPVEDGPADAAPTATATDAAPKPSATTPKDAAPVDTCKVGCTNDSECQNTCPKEASGTSCCDIPNGKCFRYTGNACPVPTPPSDGGGSTY